MNAKANTPETLQEAVKFFANYANAHAFMIKIRWTDGCVKCPVCGSDRIRYIQTRRQWECRNGHPKRRFTLKTGTIMEASPLPLEKWLAALWLEVNSKNSVSSWEVHRALGVTQKTAWFMLHRLRHALHVGSFETKMSGIVEADETFVGGKARNMHKHRRDRIISGPTGKGQKTAVMGLLERHSEKGKSKVRTEVIRNTRVRSLYAVIHPNVAEGSHLMTDALQSYRKMDQYTHSFIDHTEKYVDGIVHTNGLENFWSLFKRCIKGTHVSVEPYHLQAYVDSEAYRFNHRTLKDGGRFTLAMSGITGKRLTYKSLIGASEDLTATGI